MEHNEVLSVIEGMLFLSGDNGLSVKQISAILGINKKEAVTYLDELADIIKKTAFKISLRFRYRQYCPLSF